MSVEFVDSKKYRMLLLGGMKRLEEKCEQINKLNVFPVPDGDTGDNMLLTIRSGLAETSADDDLPMLCRSLSRGMLYGARGNSGVILSRFFYGVNSGVGKNSDSLTVNASIAGMERGVKEAYDAVSDPKEGTILTVMSDATNAVRKSRPADFSELLQTLVEASSESLRKTPELLDVLREAGVVDSGGAGLLCILEGMKNTLENGSVYDVDFNTKTGIRELTDTDEMLGYCTEFILQLMGNRDFSLKEFKTYLNSVGNSVVAFQSDNIVKVHVHTFTPEDVIAKAHLFGEFLSVKVENMTVMHNETLVSADTDIVTPKKKYGLVAVACGSGIRKMLQDGGCSVVIDGGKSMNPSAQDILEGIKQANAETVFFFPNNKNVFMAARQAKDMCDYCRVVIIGSEDIGQCYHALSLFDDSIKPEELTDVFESSIDIENTIYVSRATRSCVNNGVEIREGDCLCNNRNRVLVSEPSEEKALTQLFKNRETLPDVTILLYGENKSEEDAGRMEQLLTDTFPETEFIAVQGGQAVFDYILIDEV